MDSLNAELSTAQYIQKFFNDYVERVFIADYRDLRTKEHPLSRKSQILRTVDEIHYTNAHRERLLLWYLNKRCGGDQVKAERLFEKDIQRLEDIARIDEYLDRLDEEIRRANRRALAFLDYRLRSLQPIDHLIREAIDAAKSGNLSEEGDPFPAGEMICSERLAEPRKAVDRPAPSPLRRQAPSEEEIARSRIMLRARENRTMTPLKLAEYLSKRLENKEKIESSLLELATITDIRAYQEMARIALAMSSDNRELQIKAIMMARGFIIRPAESQEPKDAPITGRAFTIERSKPRKSKSEKMQ